MFCVLKWFVFSEQKLKTNTFQWKKFKFKVSIVCSGTDDSKDDNVDILILAALGQGARGGLIILLRMVFS